MSFPDSDRRFTRADGVFSFVPHLRGWSWQRRSPRTLSPQVVSGQKLSGPCRQQAAALQTGAAHIRTQLSRCAPLLCVCKPIHFPPASFTVWFCLFLLFYLILVRTFNIDLPSSPTFKYCELQTRGCAADLWSFFIVVTEALNPQIHSLPPPPVHYFIPCPSQERP